MKEDLTSHGFTGTEGQGFERKFAAELFEILRSFVAMVMFGNLVMGRKMLCL